MSRCSFFSQVKSQYPSIFSVQSPVTVSVRSLSNRWSALPSMCSSLLPAEKMLNPATPSTPWPPGAPREIVVTGSCAVRCTWFSVETRKPEMAAVPRSGPVDAAPICSAVESAGTQMVRRLFLSADGAPGVGATGRLVTTGIPGSVAAELAEPAGPAAGGSAADGGVDTWKLLSS